MFRDTIMEGILAEKRKLNPFDNSDSKLIRWLVG